MASRRRDTLPAPVPPRTGSRYYDDELRHLAHLLQNLPSTIPEGTQHNFTAYKTEEVLMLDYGCDKSVLNRALEISFGTRVNGTLIQFKSRGTGFIEEQSRKPRSGPLHLGQK